jgi:hypothetical protein
MRFARLQAFSSFVVVVRRPPMPINDVNRVCASRVRREHTHLTEDFSRREVANEAHLPVKPNAQAIAHPTWVETRRSSTACPE